MHNISYFTSYKYNINHTYNINFNKWFLISNFTEQSNNLSESNFSGLSKSMSQQ